MSRFACLTMLLGAIALANVCLAQAPSPPPPTPDMPDWILSPSISNTGNFAVTWDASTTSGASYLLEADTDSNFGNPQQLYSGSGTQASCTGVANGRWYLRLTVSEPTLWPGTTVVDHQTCVDTSIPAPPADPAAVQGLTVPAQSGTAFTVSWTRASGIVYYQLQQEYGYPTPLPPVPTDYPTSLKTGVYDGANNSYLVSPVTCDAA